jgi:DNA replicative helicase MCM subunit Mcm2 (Cdc46/Mcm family)
MLACLSLALTLTRAMRIAPRGAPLVRMTVRFVNVSPLTPQREFTHRFVDRLVAFRGNVLRVSSTRPLIQNLSFQCERCGSRMTTHFIDGK